MIKNETKGEEEEDKDNGHIDADAEQRRHKCRASASTLHRSTFASKPMQIQSDANANVK